MSVALISRIKKRLFFIVLCHWSHGHGLVWLVFIWFILVWFGLVCVCVLCFVLCVSGPIALIGSGGGEGATRGATTKNGFVNFNFSCMFFSGGQGGGRGEGVFV